MTCKELSSGVISAVVALTGVCVIFGLVSYLSWLTAKPLECIDGKLYEVTYKGNIKILDEQYGDICITEETR
jgi:hypothetical protein